MGYLFKLFIYFTLQHCIGFAIHWLESATGVHVFHILNPLPAPSPSQPSGSSPCTRPEDSMGYLEWRSFPGDSVVKNPPANARTCRIPRVRSLHWEDSLEEEMATHSSVLAWRIPGTGSLVGCCLWGRTESDTTEAT